MKMAVAPNPMESASTHRLRTARDCIALGLAHLERDEPDAATVALRVAAEELDHELEDRSP